MALARQIESSICLLVLCSKSYFNCSVLMILTPKYMYKPSLPYLVYHSKLVYDRSLYAILVFTSSNYFELFFLLILPSLQVLILNIYQEHHFAYLTSHQLLLPFCTCQYPVLKRHFLSLSFL